MHAVGRAIVRHARWVLIVWLAVAGAVNIFVPQLDKVIKRDSTPFLPASAASLQALEHMDAAFGKGGARSLAAVVAVDDAGWSTADQAWYAKTVATLHSDGTARVVDLQDAVDTPALAGQLLSKDGKAAYFIAGLRNPVGSPKTDADVAWLRTLLTTTRPAGVHTYVTGEPATYVDANTYSRRSVAIASFIAGLIIVAIVLLLFRNVITAAIPLVVIGVALGTARGVVAWAGLHGITVSTYTALFVMALVMGAGTDYSVFLISRFHEARAEGRDVGDAVVEASGKIGPAIIASGATVIAGTACLVVAKLGVVATTGPAMAISVFVTLLASLTFTPALITVLGERVAPRKDHGHDRVWSFVGSGIRQRPGVLLACSLVLLGGLAVFAPGVHQTFDNRSLEPSASESNTGYRAFDAHFPPGQLRPEYLLLEAGTDLRNPQSFALIDRAAAAIGALPHVRQVVTVTRPTGTPLTQAQLSSQLGTVGRALSVAAKGVGASSAGVAQLGSGVNEAQSGIQQLAGGAAQAQSAATRIAGGISAAGDGIGQSVTGAGQLAGGAGQLRSGAGALAAGLTTTEQQVATAVDGLAAAAGALDGDTLCTVDAVCQQVRSGLHVMVTGERDQLLPGLGQAAAAARQIAKGDGQLQSALVRLQHGLGQARAGLVRLSAGQRTFAQHLGGISDGAGQIAHGLGSVPGGVDKVLAGAQRLADGLGQSASYLSGTAAGVGSLAPLWLPPSTINGQQLAAARTYFLSPDGRTVRMIVYGDGGRAPAAADVAAVQSTLRGTALGSAQVRATGSLAAEADLQHYTSSDLHLVALAVLLAVGLVLVLLLRSLLAPLLLLASVALSYGATMGLTWLVMHDLLHRPLDFTLPLLTLVLLVSVGADYNILLMTRVREEGLEVTRDSVARAVQVTGRVITSAGLIFAGTFVAMLGSPVPGIYEIGFAVSVGLIIDTFIVRSMLVPSLAALIGRAIWWPSRGYRSRPSPATEPSVPTVTIDVPVQLPPRAEPVPV